MIVSQKYEFIIACPTKTGTTSMNGMVKSWLRSGGSSYVLNVVSGLSSTKHRIAPPPGMESFDRYMLVRDPHIRMVSMYEWLRRKPQDEPIGRMILEAEERHGRRHGGAAGWMRLLEAIALIRESNGYFADGQRKFHGVRPFMWTDTQSELLEYLGGMDAGGCSLPWAGDDPMPLQLEDFDREWGELLSERDVEEDALYELEFPHRNHTKVERRLFQSVGEYWKVRGARGYEDRVFSPGDTRFAWL